MSEKKENKIRTRCYYTDYVNHAIRFYLTTPDTLHTDGKRKADILNWMAVQSVFHCLKEADKDTLIEVYHTHHKLTEAVNIYCQKHNYDERKLWILITKVSALVARKRGLV